MNPFMRRFVLLAAGLGLTLVGTGCDNSRVNESGSPGAASSNAAQAQDAPPPPKSVKDYYERTQNAVPAPKGGPHPKG